MRSNAYRSRCPRLTRTGDGPSVSSSPNYTNSSFRHHAPSPRSPNLCECCPKAPLQEGARLFKLHRTDHTPNAHPHPIPTHPSLLDRKASRLPSCPALPGCGSRIVPSYPPLCIALWIQSASCEHGCLGDAIWSTPVVWIRHSGLDRLLCFIAYLDRCLLHPLPERHAPILRLAR